MEADPGTPGLFKDERVIATPRGAPIPRGRRAERPNFCANNYLGLAEPPGDHRGRARGARRAGATAWPRCASSAARRTLHKELEARLAAFLGTEDAILYSSCFDANGGLFETLLGAEDAIISDELNHASIIDGDPALQGAALPLREHATWPTSRRSCRRRRARARG